MPATFDGKAFLKTVPNRPGVYVMYGEDDACLYVGKAWELKKRLANHFRVRGASPKSQLIIARTRRVEVQITGGDGEALLLEYNLIQSLRPRYNVMMRDDKSYPYVRLTEEKFPRLVFYRGSTRRPGRYFGPYANAGAVRDVLNQIHKVIPLRQCEDSVFNNRSRPCLHYQIGRCSAPCTGLISQSDYREDVAQAALLLEGGNRTLDRELDARMERHAARLEYEEAAKYRDRIRRLRKVRSGQFVAHLRGDVDVVAVARARDRFCIALSRVRDGRNLGQRNLLGDCSPDTTEAEILGAFVSRHYLRNGPPGEIVVEHEFADQDILSNALSGMSGHRVTFKTRVRGKRGRWLAMAALNAREHLQRHLHDRGRVLVRLRELCAALGLETLPERIECFDVSHTMGEGTVASCVVFDQQGPVKAQYRRFNVKADTGGDDYAALEEALRRRYRGVVDGEGRRPDLLLVDGGPGQLNRARAVLDELGLSGIATVGVAKGLERRPGQERLFLPARRRPIILDPTSGASHLVQAIRDEAHRFAIAGHRARRRAARTVSRLERVPGIGPRKRRALLNHFGGLREVERASVEELLKTPGISRKLAQALYREFHS